MIEISVSNLSVTYGSSSILEKVSFAVQEGERVGLIGPNGAGKTTLLRILSKEEAPSAGDVFVTQGKRVGFLQQHSEQAFLANSDDDDLSILEVMRHVFEQAKRAGAVLYESEIVGILRAMAFPDTMHTKLLRQLSGGEKSRIALAALLLGKPDILLLDEPTNHLDIGTIHWLEQYLAGFRGTVILVSHDRFFLDRTVNRICEIEHHKLTFYGSSYSEYVIKKRERREIEERAYEKQRVELRRQEDMIRRFKERGTEKLAKRAASREKQLAHIVLEKRPESEYRTLHFRLAEKNRSGQDILTAENLSMAFGTHKLFSNVSFELKRGERVCLVGANGIGKTTLLKILLEELPAKSGYVRRGNGVLLGYFKQEQNFEDESRTVLDEMTTMYRHFSEGEMRNILAGFLFTGDQVFQTLSSLSGGERAKVSLVKLLLSGANTLVLDEPTNHLDIPSKEAVEDALLAFPGALLVVSHDRYFLNKIPTRILELCANGLINYPGKYDYYVEKKNSIGAGKKYMRTLSDVIDDASEAAAGPNEGSSGISEAEKRRQEKKREEAQQRRKERLRTEAEAQIEKLEAEIRETENSLESEETRSSPTALLEKAETLEQLNAALIRAYETWESLA